MAVSPDQKRIRTAALLGIMLVLFFLVRETGPVSRAVSGVSGAVYGFSVRLRQSFIGFSEALRLRDEASAMRERIASLEHEVASLQDLKTENERLAALLKFSTERTQEVIAARVTGRNVFSQNTLLLNRGSDDGVRMGAPVIVGSGVCIGTIIEADPHASTVLLLTDPAQRLIAGLTATEKSVGIASGEYGISVGLSLVPQNIALAEGDTIITSGAQQGIPRSLVIGTVSRILASDTELFKSATITPAVEYDTVTVVGVLAR